MSDTSSIKEVSLNAALLAELEAIVAESKRLADRQKLILSVVMLQANMPDGAKVLGYNDDRTGLLVEVGEPEES